MALRLIRVTGKSPAWLLISAGFCIMAIRRSISLARVLQGGIVVGPAQLWDESTALAISLTMMAGVFAIRPLFLTIKEAAAVLQQDKEVLAKKVAARTEELRDANVRLSVELDERRRAELRMAQYAEGLARSNAELEQDAAEFIAFAVDGATRMQQLINDLLAYSRVGTRGKPPAPT
ncbi:MAG: hypothetical protein NTW80_12340, partial [Deltaproteobacteria bacterium]|nr:hypothetical protein [Deltaproteobacteria bacterium]